MKVEKLFLSDTNLTSLRLVYCVHQDKIYKVSEGHGYHNIERTGVIRYNHLSVEEGKFLPNCKPVLSLPKIFIEEKNDEFFLHTTYTSRNGDGEYEARRRYHLKRADESLHYRLIPMTVILDK